MLVIVSPRPLRGDFFNYADSYFTISLNFCNQLYVSDYRLHNMFRLFLLSFLLWPLKESEQSHFIDWKANRKLTWEDFQARPVNNSDNAALTSSNINFQYGYGSNGFHYSISCRFDKSRSWVRVKSDYILAHEQGHFDIAELHARLLNQALSTYRYQEKTVDDDISRLYDGIMKQHHDMQQLYDAETDHSRNTRKQTEWLHSIHENLKRTQAFAAYRK